MENLQMLYNDWRNRGEEGSEGTNVPFTWDAGEKSAREDFTEFAELENEISFEEMSELEEEYKPNFIEKLTNKDFLVTTKWVQEHDSNIYDYLYETMEKFVEDKTNSTNESDLKNFKNGKWLVEYTFREGEEKEIEILITAGETKQHVANQPAWIQECVSIEELDNWEVEEYLKQII